MASASKTANGGWRARWRDDQGRTQGRSGFRLKTDALRYATEQEHSVTAGTYVDPTAGKVTFETYAQEWRARQVHSPGTACQVEGNLRNHVFPILGKRPLSAMKPSEVQALVKRMSQNLLAPATVEVIYRYVVAIFRAAVADRLIPSSPCVGIKLPKQEPSKVIPLAVEAVEALVDAMPPRYEAMVFVAAGTGLVRASASGWPSTGWTSSARRSGSISRWSSTPALGPTWPA